MVRKLLRENIVTGKKRFCDRELARHSGYAASTIGNWKKQIQKEISEKVSHSHHLPQRTAINSSVGTHLLSPALIYSTFSPQGTSYAAVVAAQVEPLQTTQSPLGEPTGRRRTRLDFPCVWFHSQQARRT